MTFPYRLEARPTPSRVMQLAVPVVAAAATLVIGFLILSLVGQDPLRAMHAFFVEPLSTINGWSELVLKASPLCLIGLGLAVGYRANVWNIGAEGQMLLGGIAIHASDASGWWTLPLMMIGGIAGGMAWAAIPTLLKSRFNTNEILTSLMLTYVATQLLIYLVSGPWCDPESMNFPISAMFGDDALFQRLYGDWHWTWLKGTRINASVFLTAIAIPCVWLFMRKSFAGLAGMGEVAGPIGQLQAGWSPGYGSAIIVVFVERLHPVGIVLASLLMALLYLGGEAVQTDLAATAASARGRIPGAAAVLPARLRNYRIRRRTPGHHTA
ncbi:MAG: Nucleoside ABC transporter, permease protein 1 [uncultured Caballeronia sp.]|nr:MAG: Nucleoside ABC transporter, permease protein 1 [uncultured Caballeronia sp.]